METCSLLPWHSHLPPQPTLTTTVATATSTPTPRDTTTTTSLGRLERVRIFLPPTFGFRGRIIKLFPALSVSPDSFFHSPL